MTLFVTAIAFSVSASTDRPTIAFRHGAGVQCVPYGETKPDGPVMYLVDDIGKPGVPRPNAQDAKMLAKILRWYHTRTMRFTYLPLPLAGIRFIVFDADDQVCIGDDPGFQILNGPCNAFYNPGNSPTSTTSTDICGGAGTPRPWFPHEAKQYHE